MEILEAIGDLVEGKHLRRRDAEAIMESIMTGGVAPVQTASFLTALRMKGETVEELIGFARVLRDKATPVEVPEDDVTSLSGTDREMLLDTCGTGGDASGTFNISTATAFVVAGAGVRVAKHGNRSISSVCGSADVVEALGIRINLTPQAVARCIREVGIGFLYAPVLHKAMRYVMPVRRELKIRTVFNLLGPLCNPARASAQVLGVYGEDLTETMAEVLSQLGVVRAFVVHGSDGLDEITITGETKVSEVRQRQVKTYYLSPEDLGLKRAGLESIRGGDARENATIIMAVLSGEQGSRQDVVLMNASAGLVAAGKAKGFEEGIELARESIDTGKALAALKKLTDWTAELASQT